MCTILIIHLVTIFNLTDIFFGITHGQAYFDQELTKRQDEKASENRFA